MSHLPLPKIHTGASSKTQKTVDLKQWWMRMSGSWLSKETTRQHRRRQQDCKWMSLKMLHLLEDIFWINQCIKGELTWRGAWALKCNLLQGFRVSARKNYLLSGGTEREENVKETWKACKKELNNTSGRKTKALKEKTQVEKWNLNVIKFKRRKNTRLKRSEKQLLQEVRD